MIAADGPGRRGPAHPGHPVSHHAERRIPLVGAPILILRGEHDSRAASWAVQATALARIGGNGVVPRAAHNAVTTAGTVVAAEAITHAHALLVLPRPSV